MACVITVDGKSYDETGFKQMLGSGFLVNEINNGVLKDSKSEIYKQYINGNGTKEVTEGEGGQALQESVAPEGKGAETDQAVIESEAGNEIPGIELLTEDQKAEFDLAVKSINANRETPISAKEAFNKLVAYLGAEEIPLITNMKSALETALDQSRAKNILKGLERSGKTKMSAKIAKSKLGRTLLGLAASMKSLGISMVVLSDEDFDNFIKDAYGISPDRNAIYVWGAKTMVLRASNTSQVAIHEFVHPILSIIQSIDEGMYESLMGDIDQLYHPSGMTFLKWAEKNYAGASLDTIKNEALTELISVVAQKRVDLKSSIAIAANKIWNSIMSFFGIKGAPINLKFDDTLTVDKLSKAISEAIVTFRSLEVENAVGIEQPTAEGIASSKDRDLVADAGLDKYMTEDGNGNYVFYHVSDLDLTKKGIDPNKLGSNARTGRDEVMAKHPVSMYYTEPDIDDVGGLYKHVMLIPKDKVYPIDSDPLNLKPQAEKEFRKVFPNISFDNNRASSWIAKVAAEKGYEMVVANWSPRRNFKALRAESVIKHKPKLYQSPRPGSFNAVVFNDKYEFESNRTSLKKRLEKSSSPDVITGGKMNKKAISSSKVTSTPAINVYEAKEVTVLPVVSLEELYDKYDGKAIVINSDPTRVGELKLPSGKNIFMYGGPGYLSIKNNVDGKVGFATTQIDKVKTWQKYAQTLFGKGSSLTLVATQSPVSILGNSYALRYVMDAISTLPKSVLKSSEFKTEFFGKDITLLANAFGEKAYKEFVSKYKKLDLSNPEVIDQMISDMAYKVGDNNSPASFRARRAFVSNLIAKVGVKKPVKFIAQELFKRHGLNTEKLLYEIGEKELVDLYLNGNKWGFLVSGFETDPKITIDSVQTSGIKHPLFNAKFPASSSFLLDGAYEVDKLFTPQVIETKKGGLYTKKAAQMLSGSMYVKGERTENKGSFEYSKGAPIEGTKGISSNRSTPLPGAPSTGPDMQLVSVAEKYARDNGIAFDRQSEYVPLNENLSKRIADEYEKMDHNPSDPKVKEAFENLIKQTRAQYDALVEAGYKFKFFDSKSDPYNGNPMDAMRDLRNNKEMSVYGTYDGFGTDGITKTDSANNPMLEDTGLLWPDQDGKMHTVTANDLFRAVHDAFGHGLEGAGFRARGEENAWQAHVKLFTGSAIAALTTETRGQNSWLNYGPHGEKNRTAKVEDTIFAEQKTGLMPEWTWTEGLASEGRGISSSRSTNVTSKFAESAKLFDQIQEADGSAKKRRLAEERRALIESSPEVKFIDDNIKKIYEQLENKGILKREGNCP